MTRRAPLPRLLRRDLTRAILLRVAGMVIGVEGIYLSDKLLTELLAHTLKFGLGIGFLLQSLVLALPEILFLGLPPALFVAFYLALFAKRESGELLVAQLAGLPPRAVVGYLAGVGAVMGGLALVLAGWVEPLASAALGDKLREARIAAINQPLMVAGQFINLPPVTLYAHGRGAQGAGVFALMRQPDGGLDVITATKGETRIDRDSGAVRLFFTGSQILSFAPVGPDEPLGAPQNLRAAQMTFSGITLDLPPNPARNAQVSGRTLNELWADPRRPALAEGLARLFGAALAAVAPLLAGLAVARAKGWTLRGQIWPAVGLAGILAAGLALPAAAHQVARLGPGAGLVCTGLVFGAAFVIAARHLCQDHHRWMVPCRVRR